MVTLLTTAVAVSVCAVVVVIVVVVVGLRRCGRGRAGRSGGGWGMPSRLGGHGFPITGRPWSMPGSRSMSLRPLWTWRTGRPAPPRDGSPPIGHSLRPSHCEGDRGGGEGGHHPGGDDPDALEHDTISPRSCHAPKEVCGLHRNGVGPGGPIVCVMTSILIVEDDQRIRERLTKALRHAVTPWTPDALIRGLSAAVDQRPDVVARPGHARRRRRRGPQDDPRRQ
jgi:hypothetical protein